jgi:hypothetical protein
MIEGITVLSSNLTQYAGMKQTKKFPVDNLLCNKTQCTFRLLNILFNNKFSEAFYNIRNTATHIASDNGKV